MNKEYQSTGEDELVRLAQWIRSSRQDRGNLSESYWQKNKSPILGVDDVISFRVDRARALGNAVCVEQTREAFKELIGLD